jgi:hypothetical protein
MRILGAIIAAALLVFFALCYFAGVFDSLRLSVQEVGPYALIYREHKGPVQGVRFVLFNVYAYLKDKRSIRPERGFVVFLDNPQKTKKEELHSRAGYITDSLLTNVDSLYKTDVFPRTRAVTGTIRLRSFMSPMSGSVKFYSKLPEFLHRQMLEPAGPVMEIYDIPAKKILYCEPVK